MKIISIYVCSSCGEQQSKWSGKCLSCNAWNALVEDAIEAKEYKKVEAKTIEIKKISLEDAFSKRIETGIQEFDRVLGGGIIHDSLILLSGDPGIGKSTLSLQVALKLASQEKNILYISGEESVAQISSRAKRMMKNEEFNLHQAKFPDVISAIQLESIIATIKRNKPDLVIADSVQTIGSAEVTGMPGSIMQVRQVAEAFMEISKQDRIPTILIGHVNKEGNLAGPKVLEHLVDTVLYLEGERYHDLRMLRALKNRFGSTNEVGIFSMTETGLAEVKNPSEIFLQGRKKGAIGSALSVTMEGVRPFVLEVQALTNSADYSYPKRAASGVDQNRVQLLTAVLNKHARLKLDQQDIYVNIAGGFRVRDPAIDLGIIAAIISSRQEIPLPDHVAYIGEVGLTGEIRPVSHEAKRLKEIEKLGFREAWGNIRGSHSGKLKVRQVDDIKKLSLLRTS